MMITREILLDAMKEDKELEKLVFGYGGVDRAVAGMNILVPAMEKAIDTIKNTWEALNNIFSCSDDDIDLDEEDDFEMEEDLFKKALDMCDYDIEVRYTYLNNLLCNLEDEQLELYEKIEQAKCDQEIAEILITDYDVDVRNDLIYANKQYVELSKELDEIEARIEATTDLFDEVYFNIISNLE